MSRRALLKAAGFGVGAAAFGACGTGSESPGSASAAAESGTPDWNTLRARLSGRLVLPGDAGYDAARLAYNPLFDDQRPTALAECATPADVQACIETARCAQVPIAARSGGHSYGGYSTPNGGLVVDLGGMSHVVVNPNGTATVGAGAQLIDVYAALAAAGRCLPAGSCPTVGIAGLTLGGGIGVLNRAYGLTCDALLSADVVLADGSRRTASAGADADLFWALRGGGGGNFGIVTSFEFSTRPAPSVTVFGLGFPAGSVAEGLGAWQDWQSRMPNELWSNCVVSGGNPPGCYVGGCFVGSAASLAPLLDDLVRCVGVTPTSRASTEKGYLDAMRYFAGCDAFTVEQCHRRNGDDAGAGQLNRAASVASSRMLAAPMSDPGKVADLMRDQTGINLLIDALGGAIADRAPHETAFVHRTALASVQIHTGATADTEASAKQAVAHIQKSLAAIVGTGAYVNYIDPDMSDWATACYGSNLARLRAVAHAYDPDQIFAFAQNVSKSY